MLRVYLTGELCLTSSAAVVRSDRFPGRQGRLAFVLLAAERSRPVARDELIELLWPADAPAAVEVALSAVISKLRSLLADVGLSRNALTSIAHCHQLRLPADSWIDLEAAVEAVHGAESALRSGAHADAYGPAVVANAMFEYYKLGATSLLIRGYDPRPDAIQYGKELIPRIRELVAQDDAARGAASPF